MYFKDIVKSWTIKLFKYGKLNEKYSKFKIKLILKPDLSYISNCKRKELKF